MSREVTNLLYLITIVTFILALRFLSNPATARRGNQIGAVGMLVAIVVTFLQKSIDSYWEIILGMVVGGTFGAVAARKVRMTAMPRSEERRVGKECSLLCRSRWSPYH